MTDNARSSPNAVDTPEAEGQREVEITPKLVHEIADKVYAMFLHESRINYERQRLPRSPRYRQGGR